ncbi:MAG: Hsp20/alpha crystallin family protein [Kiloniellales bacterium]|nr:Hsp20/alpha crystallin family protein [Kiloniellales bacterium]
MTETDRRSLEVQEKKELVEKEEMTVPARYYVPYTDIFETENALTVVMEMAGVTKDNVSIEIENDVLKVEGRIDFSDYAEMQPVYTEYNVGHYSRKFGLPAKVDREKISADIDDGVLTLTLPKAEEAKPRKITIS